jgi:hypothetical protein
MNYVANFGVETLEVYGYFCCCFSLGNRPRTDIGYRNGCIEPGSLIFGTARQKVFLFSIAPSYLELATNGLHEGVGQ